MIPVNAVLLYERENKEDYIEASFTFDSNNNKVLRLEAGNGIDNLVIRLTEGEARNLVSALLEEFPPL